MSSAAKFILEFQTTGDQEIVQKLRDIGTAGQDSAQQLQELQGAGEGIEGSLTGLGSAAGEAAGPLEELGTAATDAVTPLGEMGTAGEELGGIFDGAGTASEEFGGALSSMTDSTEAVSGGLTEATTMAEGFGDSMGGVSRGATGALGGLGQMSGAVVGLGGTIGSAISTMFRMQDAQLSLDKANLKAAKSTEVARKAQVGFDNLLKTAKGNTDGITTARNALSTAQDRLNQLQEQGITSGSEYEAAQAAVSQATQRLRAEFVKGGGDANKFDAAMNKVAITQDAMTIAARNLEKATRTFGQTQLETGLSVAGFVGTAIQAVSSLKNIKDGAEQAAKAFKPLITAIKPIAGVISGMAIGFASFIGVMTAIDQNVGGVKDALKGVHDYANEKVPQLSALWDHLGKTFESNTKGYGAWGAGLMKALGIPVKEAPKAAKAMDDVTKKVETMGVGMDESGKKIAGAFKSVRIEWVDLGKDSYTLKDGILTVTDSMHKNLIGTKFVKSAYEDLGGGVMRLNTNFNTSAGAMYEAAGGLDATGKSAGGTATELGKVILAGGQLGSTAGTITDATGKAALEVGKLGSVSATGAQGAQQLTDSILKTSSGAQDMYDAIMTTSGGVKDMNFTLDESTKHLDHLSAGFNQLVANANTFIDLTKGLNSILTNTTSTVKTNNQVILASGGAFVQVGDKIGETGKGLEDLGNGYSRVNGSIVKNTDILNRQGLSVEKVAKAIPPWNDMVKASGEAHVALGAKVSTTVTPINAVTKAIEDDTAAKKEQNKINSELIGSEQDVANAFADVQGKFIESARALEKVKAMKDSASAAALQLRTTLNEELTSLIEEEMALKASLAATSDREIQQQRLKNATLEAANAVAEFISSIDEEKAAFATTTAMLQPLVEGHMDFGDSLGWTHDQMKQFIGVVEGAPGALQELASQINSLSNETIGWVEQIKGDKQEVEKVFGKWKLSDAFPEEIRNIMSKAQQEFIAGKAQVTRVADTFGPAIASAFEFAARNQNFQSFREFGPKAAAEIEAGFDGAVPPVLQNVVSMLQNPPGNIAEGLPWMQQIITEFENAKNPMISWMQEYLKMGGTLDSVQGKLAASAEGLNSLFSAMDTGADAGETLNLKLDQLNKVAIEGVGTFAQVGGQLIPIPGAANAAAGGISNFAASFNPLNTAIQSAAASLTQFQSYLNTNAPKFTVDIGPALQQLQSLKVQIGAASVGATIKINADITPITSAAAKAMQNVAGIKAGFGPVTAAASQSAGKMAESYTKAAAKSMQNIAGIKAGFGPINSAVSSSASKLASSFTSAASKAVSAINRIGAAARALPNISRTISYKRVLTGVNVNSLPNLSRTITYKRVVTGAAPRATGFSGEVSQPTLLMVGDQGRERVSVEPINTSVPGMGGTKGGYRGGAGGGGPEKPMKLVGDLYFDTYKVGRIIGRAIAENNV
jgi:hypothetical protein